MEDCMVQINPFERDTDKNSHWLNNGEFGWRGIIGLITPSVAFTTEHEWSRMMPKGLAFVTTRIFSGQVTVEALDQMGRYVEDAIKMMESACVDAICYGCTSGSMSKGIKYDEELIEHIEKSTKKTATTMAKSVVKALKHSDLKRVAVVTPYPDEVNLTVRKFLEDNGLKVVAIEGLQIIDPIEIRKLPPSMAYECGKNINLKAPDCDGVFVSCGNFRTIEILPGLEKDIGKPVISSNQAMFWDALNILGVNDPLYGYGSLLEKNEQQPEF
jgi:maleate cis-trans isomerase